MEWRGLVALPFYTARVSSRGRVGEVRLEAFLSRHSRPEEICLLSRVSDLEDSPLEGALRLPAWGEARDVLDWYVGSWQVLEGARVGGEGGWAMRRLANELQRLLVGGLVTRPEKMPTSTETFKVGIARGLCRSTLGFIEPSSYLLISSRLAWKNLAVSVSEGELIVERRDGGRDKVFGYIIGNNEEARRVLLEGIGYQGM